jgi:ABC-type phosphate transport system substrate-binding protein
MRWRSVLLGAIGIGLILLPVGRASPGGEDRLTIAVIVAKGAPPRSLNRETLADVFLRQQTFWANRDPIVPVNLDVSHPLRRSFSERVIRLNPDDLDNYWNDQYFHGIFPPHVLQSEEAVMRYVAETPQAIGYVSACMADSRVRTLLYLTPTGSQVDREHKLNCARTPQKAP